MSIALQQKANHHKDSYKSALTPLHDIHKLPFLPFL